ncbi:hypothetical protein A2574_01445 [Candidatus Shapirobacteria bacterium RIFOXYD1_FULL_38_32]|uniref:Uncharacterized protein n=1 Tax=Candidatus Shapirobacteria bacterium RIFOXYB1_FULL_38_38 TaxID=1802151 RepID=A0A1F7SRI6_9BACT|nr:MAG: hypothetical protein A2367_01410 [Candidatus Shapirobacteria bacterium RIFOXYB1_FULL_38_38]OGL56582.1 MAG: hypothetical protein A2195_00760 [Candidatus Shapirobacteria bacterium RIFOXYA1_FULL_39_17]OGL57765.1 MAG: hypothetical protein A2410_00535 [Candidatus Shapirobacteria bacterium RIFOXYC1_FULL_38_24]OGL58168.1 MAG: hypothetical protein A2574_01445 [Candidatus Shapirobacteria bacterium RIFOXYD1_FULL_38_32]HCU54934.1 hypothetical protein [Candidatus Shapirobacteria bacterium]
MPKITKIYTAHKIFKTPTYLTQINSIYFLLTAFSFKIYLNFITFLLYTPYLSLTLIPIIKYCQKFSHDLSTISKKQLNPKKYTQITQNYD